MRFQLRGDPPEIDFDNSLVLLVGFGESGSCPYEYGGVEIDVADKVVSIIDGGDPDRACTDDYNPRMLGLRLDRRMLPEGIFRVKPPTGAAVSVAADHVESAPQEDPTYPAPPPDRLTAPFSVYVTLDPEPVTSDDQLGVGIRNDGDAPVVADVGIQLDRWTGLGFERQDLPRIRGNRDVVRVAPGDEEQLLTVDLGGHAVSSGWYRVTLDAEVMFRGYGSILVRRAVEVLEPSEA
jgi:hypothetical protein